uniref:G-protein coupled receptors family 1 profile domain-containing protein n=1 Tax=Latimeria chalumnae TaxID=7897 RepID=H3AWE4_LATCH
IPALKMTLPLALCLDSLSDIAFFIIHILLATMPTVIAGSVLLTIAFTKSLRQEHWYLYIFSTSTGDFLSGFAFCYRGFFDVQEVYSSKTGMYFILPSLLGVNLITIMAAQIDRYYAVTSPFKYQQKVTRNKTIGVCVGIWIYNYLLFLLHYLWSSGLAGVLQGGLALSVNIAAFTMIGLNLKLCSIAKNQISENFLNAEIENKRTSVQLITMASASYLLVWFLGFVNTCMCHLTPICFRFQHDIVNPWKVLTRCSHIATPLLCITKSSQLREAVFAKVWKPCCNHRSR